MTTSRFCPHALGSIYHGFMFVIGPWHQLPTITEVGFPHLRVVPGQNVPFMMRDWIAKVVCIWLGWPRSGPLAWPCCVPVPSSLLGFANLPKRVCPAPARRQLTPVLPSIKHLLRRLLLRCQQPFYSALTVLVHPHRNSWLCSALGFTCSIQHSPLISRLQPI